MPEEDNVSSYICTNGFEVRIISCIDYLLEGHRWGDPDGRSNESWYLSGVQQLIDQLEIYDQVWVARDLSHALQKVPGKIP